MSDNGFLRNDRLKSVLSRIKSRVGSDIASAISESTSTLSSVITSGDLSSLNEAKGYADGLKVIIDSNISNGDTSTLNSAKSYTDGKISSVNSTINDLSESIPGQISLALEDYAEYTDLTAHTSNTSNPHSVTYTQTGAAAASHTHTESDITDLGNYAAATHSHNLSDINSISATTAEINYLSGATGNIQQQLNSLVTSGSTLTLADLGGASSTDLSNHTGNTNNPHSVTYTQVGAAPSSHTHTESDITDLGNYASSSHTHVESDITDLGNYAVTNHSHTLSNITDVIATPTEVNYLSNSTKNIQTQIDNCRFYGFFSEWEYEKEYHIGDVIKVPFCKPFMYLECIVDGISGYVQKLTIYNSNDDSIDQEYNYLPWTQQNSFYKNDQYGVIEYTNLKLIDLENFEVGNTIIDGTTVWLVQDIRDGRLIGEVTYGLTNPNFYTTYNCYGIYPNNSKYNFFDSAFDCKVEMKSIYLKYIRFLKVSMMSIVLTAPNAGTSSKPGRFLNLQANTSLSLENGSTWTTSTPDHYGTHIVGAMVIMDWAFNPFTYLDSNHIDNIDPRVFGIININQANNEFGATYTNTQYIDCAISLKHAINTGLLHGNDSFYLNTIPINNKYIRFGHYGRIYYSGLPNITGNISSIRGYQGSSVANSGSSSALYWNTIQTSTSNWASTQHNITSGNKAGADVRFSASRTNSIYGNSTVVQPETIEFELIIKF